jgi:hypothetical protein
MVLEGGAIYLPICALPDLDLTIRKLVSPAGSNRSSHGGDKMAEAFGVAGHI